MALTTIHLRSNEGLYLENHPLANAKCPLCGEDYKSLSTSHAYCTHCGLKMYVRHDKQLERKCSRCNTLSPKDARYCRLCGKKMGLSDGYVFDARVFPPTSTINTVFTDEKEWRADFRAKNYEFVDLGLSVLWGQEALLKDKNDNNYYRDLRKKTLWMNENTFKREYWCVFNSNESISYEEFIREKYIYDYALVIRDNKEYIYTNTRGRDEMILVESLFEKYDLINRRMGGNCRVPTKKEIEELLTRCKWKPESRVVPPDSSWGAYNQEGFRITGPSGKSIFMISGNYWTSNEASPGKAYALAIFPPDRRNIETRETIHPYTNTNYHSRNWSDVHLWPRPACWWPVTEK